MKERRLRNFAFAQAELRRRPDVPRTTPLRAFRPTEARAAKRPLAQFSKSACNAYILPTNNSRAANLQPNYLYVNAYKTPSEKHGQLVANYDNANVYNYMPPR